MPSMIGASSSGGAVQRGFGVLPPRRGHSRRPPMPPKKQRQKTTAPPVYFHATWDPQPVEDVDTPERVDAPSSPTLVRATLPRNVVRTTLVIDKLSQQAQRRESASQSSTSCYSTDDFLTDDEDSAGSIYPTTEPPGVTRGCLIRSTCQFLRKQVRFQDDSDGNVECHYSLKPIPLTEVDVQNFWWNAKELEEIRHKARKVRNHIIRNCPDYVQATHQLLCQLGAIQQRTLSTPTQSQRHALIVLMTREARGFEKALLMQMDIPYPSHHYSVHGLIQRQAQLRHECSDNDNDDPAAARTMDLARSYHEEALPAVAWASLLAEGDALVVHTPTTQVDL